MKQPPNLHKTHLHQFVPERTHEEIVENSRLVLRFNLRIIIQRILNKHMYREMFRIGTTSEELEARQQTRRVRLRVRVVVEGGEDELEKKMVVVGGGGTWRRRIVISGPHKFTPVVRR